MSQVLSCQSFVLVWRKMFFKIWRFLFLAVIFFLFSFWPIFYKLCVNWFWMLVSEPLFRPVSYSSYSICLNFFILHVLLQVFNKWKVLPRKCNQVCTRKIFLFCWNDSVTTYVVVWMIRSKRTLLWQASVIVLL